MPAAHGHKDGHRFPGDVSGLEGVRGPEGTQAMANGKCWQVLYSQRSRGPRDGESPPGPSPSQGQTSSRGGHAENRHNLGREESQAWASRHKALHTCQAVPGDRPGAGGPGGWALATAEFLETCRPSRTSFLLGEPFNLLRAWSGLPPSLADAERLRGPIPTCQESKSHSLHWPSLHITLLLHPPARYTWTS